MINRYPGSAIGRNAAVEHDGIVYAVAVAPEPTSSMREQTEQTLAELDARLARAGSDKTRLLSATVYITDMASKAEMDAEWNRWIGRSNWPQRACVEAGLAADTLVEITVIAARSEDAQAAPPTPPSE